MSLFDKLQKLVSIIDKISDIAGEKIAKIHEAAELAWTRTKARYYGQKFCIIGPKSSGKSTLLNVLRNPEVSDSELMAIPATEVDNYAGFSCEWNVTITDSLKDKFKLKVRKNSDVGGEDYIRDDNWLKVIKGSSIIFYVLDYDMIKKKNASYHTKIRSDFDWIGGHVHAFEPDARIIVIFNKVDKYCNTIAEYETFVEKQQSQINELVDLWKQNLPKRYRNIVLSANFLSLHNRVMRNDAIDEIIKELMSPELISLLKKRQEAA